VLGKSQIRDGSEKYDYLCNTTVSLLGVQTPVVVKVAPNQPTLLGLDVMVKLAMIIDIAHMTYEIADRIVPASESTFNFIDFAHILSKLKLVENDLVPVQTLPAPNEAYKQIVATGSSNFVLDLGSTLGFCVCVENSPKIVVLGNTY